jgi:peptidyl-prolyl cis-trans isomerase SurA
MTFKWKAPKEGSPAPLFSLGGGKVQYTLGDFTDFLGKSSRKRIRMNKKITVDEAVRQLYQEFVDQSCLKYEESRLEEKYPEFKSLMREYEEGILLFEATKMLVWDKASQDSAGLADFYKTIEGKYRWEERAVVTQYSISTEHKDRIDEIRKIAKLNSMDKALAQINLDGERILNAEEKTYEKSRFDYKDIPWEVGSLSKVEENARNKTLNFVKIEQLLPVSIKTLQEARGYVVADYQDQLEQKWVDSLRDEYKIKVNQNVFKKLIKK